ncbi:MAG: cytochrome c biogenesis CcdA family protein [Pseudoruegeria sp.]
MDLLFAYGAGLLTLINPCVLPVLPIVLATALQADARGPMALAAGMSLAFVSLGLLISSAGYALGLSEELVSQAAAVMMIVFGVVLLFPRLSAVFASATSGLSSRADSEIDGLDRGTLRGQFLGGMLLGAVWSPCVGPTLGGAISLASQGGSLIWAGSVMFAFAIGVSTIILFLAYGTRSVLVKRQATMRKIATRSRPILGGVFIFVGVAILMRWHHIAEAWAVQNLPAWLTDLSVSL